MRNRNLAGFGRILEVMMASGRADETPAVCLQLPNDIPRILAHLSRLERDG